MKNDSLGMKAIQRTQKVVEDNLERKIRQFDMRKKIMKALSEDFHNLYRKEFTSDWKAARFIRDIELSVMSLDHITNLVTEEVRKAKLRYRAK